MPAINPGANPAAALPDGVRCLPQAARVNLVGQLTNCYLLDTAEGTWVVDPPHDRAAELAEIEGAARGPIRGVLVTHSHPDHIAGVAPLVARHGVAAHAHPAARPTLGEALPFVPLREGATVAGWQVWELPGHRFDSLAFFEPTTGVALVGDLVAGAGTVVLDPSDGGLGEYLASLRRVRDEMRPALLAPGHGPLVDEPARLIDHYIAHRLERERRVLAALGAAPAPLAALLPRAYPDLPAALHPLAERSLLTHLLKLAQEGRAVQEEEGWRLP